ncbi:hypothetical protein BCR37DRAFT_382481 [Protomyces lactucae-debilis]|uniref:Uncharacterized protein n=1 Tax=Protomyces lactucae-debilis TaxID=2754530 RepID=A0A1Y2F2W0_PROLT|nr:uncharacterized protein BCR37DRAFT_382481 [Protomyces lactucae-debilis]ORY78209.1 hypothetical protein BCR37DRAFT_382481 [Protomyces lactucae-debilis]
MFIFFIHSTQQLNMYLLVLPLVILLMKVQSKTKNCQQVILTFRAYPNNTAHQEKTTCKDLCYTPENAMYNTVMNWNSKAFGIDPPKCFGDDGACVTFGEPDTGKAVKGQILQCTCEARLEIMRWHKKSVGQDSCGTNTAEAAKQLATQLGTGGEKGLKWVYRTMKPGKSVYCGHRRNACKCMYTAGTKWPPEKSCIS